MTMTINELQDLANARMHGASYERAVDALLLAIECGDEYQLKQAKAYALFYRLPVDQAVDVLEGRLDLRVELETHKKFK